MEVTSFSFETWKTIALVCTVLGWLFGFLTLASGIAAHCAKTNAEIAKKAPRSLTPKQASAMAVEGQAKNEQEKEISVLLISIGGQESDS
jgi:hypothetical protein